MAGACLALVAVATSIEAVQIGGDREGATVVAEPLRRPAPSDPAVLHSRPPSNPTVLTTAEPSQTVQPTKIQPKVEPVEAPAATEVPEVPSIMLVGDSITHGGPGTHTWRYFLYQRLAEVYGEDDFFVGPTQEPAGGDAESYAVADGWDKDHAALSGRMLDCYLDGLIDNEWCGDTNLAAADLEAHDPDLVIVLLGTNDVLLGWGPSTPAEYIADAEQLVALARANNPAVSMLLMGVLPVEPAELPDAATEQAELNTGLEALAARLDSPTARVAYAPADTDFDTAIHTIDGVHPNSLGDETIGANVAAALAEHFDIANSSDRNPPPPWTHTGSSASG
jgi:acyl-CoA thioesterase-1